MRNTMYSNQPGVARASLATFRALPASDVTPDMPLTAIQGEPSRLRGIGLSTAVKRVPGVPPRGEPD